MSGIVEQHDREEELASKNELLQQLLDSEEITGDTAGITKQVIAKGEESLSDKQEYVFNEQVRKPFLQLRCVRCGEQIAYDSVLEAYHGDGLCPSCAHDRDKFFQE